MFGRVASYVDSYLGIQSITSKGLEAVADVALPAVASRCSAGTLLSPPVFDNFLLIGELHATSLTDLADDRVFICNGFDAVIPHVDSDDLASVSQGPWTILSSLDPESDKTVLCEIFVFTACRKTLSLAIMGARFTQISINSLKALGALNGSPQVEAHTKLDWVAESHALSNASACLGLRCHGANPPRATDKGHIDTASFRMHQGSGRESCLSTLELTPTDDGQDSQDTFSKQTQLPACSDPCSDQ